MLRRDGSKLFHHGAVDHVPARCVLAYGAPLMAVTWPLHEPFRVAHNVQIPAQRLLDDIALARALAHPFGKLGERADLGDRQADPQGFAHH